MLFFWEDDDYYAPNYVELMLKAYAQCDPKPLVFGLAETIYYNIRLRKWVKINHQSRASAMNTGITAEAYHKFPWSPDTAENYDPIHGKGFLDAQLWAWARKHKVGKVFFCKPGTVLTIGMKHGIGKCGGSHHDTNESEWLIKMPMHDQDLSWLKQHIVPEVFPFYEELARKLKK